MLLRYVIDKLILNRNAKSDARSLCETNTPNMVNALALTSGLLSFNYLALFLYNSLYKESLLLSIYIVSMFAIPYLNRLNLVKATTLIYLFLTNATIGYFCFLFGYNSNAHWIYTTLIITPFLFFSINNRDEFAVLILNIVPSTALLAIFEYLKLNPVYPLTHEMLYILKYLSLTTVALAILIKLVLLRISIDLKTKSLTQALAENKVYRTALDQTAIVVFTDTDGNIIEANENFYRISQYSKDEIIGKNHQILNSGYHNNEFFKNMWRDISKGLIWRGELCNKTKNNELYWEDTSIAPYYGENEKIEKYFSVRFDITTRKNAEQQLIQSEKMATLGQMAAGIAHEINTPLAINQVLYKKAEKELSKDPVDIDQLKSILTKIESTSDRITKIVRGLKNISRNGAHDPMMRENLYNMITETIALCRQKHINSGVNLHISPFNQDIELDCRKVEISQVVLNFISNAIDAVESYDEKWVKLDVEPNSTTVKIIVTDSGPGIKPEIAEKIFQPFFTTKAVGKGTGLGLSISIATIRSHNGSISLDSNCSNTRFVIELPLVQVNSDEPDQDKKMTS